MSDHNQLSEWDSFITRAEQIIDGIDKREIRPVWPFEVGAPE